MIQHIIDQLLALARGEKALYPKLYSPLYGALLKGDRDLLGAIQSQAIHQFDAIVAFDSLMDAMCADTSPSDEGKSWRTVAMTLVIKGPEVLQRLPGEHPPSLGLLNFEALRRSLSLSSGIPLRHLRVDPRAVSGQRAFAEDPVDVFRRASQSKVWAKAPEALRGALPRAPVSDSPDWRWHEVVVLVNVFGTADNLFDAQSCWEALAYDKMEFAIGFEHGESLTLAGALDEASGAWSCFSAALHAGEGHQVRQALADAAVANNLPLQRLQMAVALIEGLDDDDRAIRVSIVESETGELLAGQQFFNPYEPGAVTTRLDELAAMLGMPELHCAEPTYFEVEVQRPEDREPRFFVPGKGWLLVPSGAAESMASA